MENILKYEKLVNKIASKYSRYSNFEDLRQVGMIGLLKAVDKYKKSDTKFTTYAYIWIKGEILEYLRCDRNIKLSKDIISLKQEINICIEELTNRFNRKPTLEEISYFLDDSGTKCLIVLLMSATKFYIIISFVFRVLSNLDFSEKEKLIHKIISTCIYGCIIIAENYNFMSIKLILMILLIFYLHYFLKKGINEFISIFLDKIGDNIFLYGVLYNIPYLIYCSAFALCFVTCLTFFPMTEVYLGYIGIGIMIFSELLKNCVFLLFSGLLYLSMGDLEVKSGKPVEIKVGKM